MGRAKCLNEKEGFVYLVGALIFFEVGSGFA